MKYYVYVLEDDNGKLYKGLTNDLNRRPGEHLRGKTRTTRKMSNPKLVYYESYKTFSEARKKEIYLKTAAGRRFLKKKMDINMHI